MPQIGESLVETGTVTDIETTSKNRSKQQITYTIQWMAMLCLLFNFDKELCRFARLSSHSNHGQTPHMVVILNRMCEISLFIAELNSNAHAQRTQIYGHLSYM